MDLVVYIDAIAHGLMLAHVGLTPHFMDLCLGTFDEEFDLVIMHRVSFHEYSLGAFLLQGFVTIAHFTLISMSIDFGIRQHDFE